MMKDLYSHYERIPFLAFFQKKKKKPPKKIFKCFWIILDARFIILLM